MVELAPNTSKYRCFYFMSPKEALQILGGYYRCPRKMLPDGTEQFLGPLVLYTSQDEDGKRHVGFEYVDCTVLVPKTPALHAIVERLYSDIIRLPYKQRPRALLCGIPTGGKILTEEMKFRNLHPSENHLSLLEETRGRREKQFVFTPGSRLPEAGDEIVVVEDVCNTFSSTIKAIKLVEGCGARVTMVSCFLNRSSPTREVIEVDGREIPVRALWTEPMPVYRQDDPRVRGLIKIGGIVGNPKAKWGRLVRIMREYSA